jgi:hypothetical protein
VTEKAISARDSLGLPFVKPEEENALVRAGSPRSRNLVPIDLAVYAPFLIYSNRGGVGAHETVPRSASY